MSVDVRVWNRTIEVDANEIEVLEVFALRTRPFRHCASPLFSKLDGLTDRTTRICRFMCDVMLRRKGCLVRLTVSLLIPEVIRPP